MAAGAVGPKQPDCLFPLRSCHRKKFADSHTETPTNCLGRFPLGACPLETVSSRFHVGTRNRAGQGLRRDCLSLFCFPHSLHDLRCGVRVCVLFRSIRGKSRRPVSRTQLWSLTHKHARARHSNHPWSLPHPARTRDVHPLVTHTHRP